MRLNYCGERSLMFGWRKGALVKFREGDLFWDAVLLCRLGVGSREGLTQPTRGRQRTAGETLG
jgi:hypothetical protein